MAISTANPLFSQEFFASRGEWRWQGGEEDRASNLWLSRDQAQASADALRRSGVGDAG